MAYKDYSSEETLEIFEAKEAAYNDGLFTGVMFGLPIGTIGTLLIGYLTAETWLPLLK